MSPNARRLAAVALLVTVVTGCSSADPGYTKLKTGRVELQRPTAWQDPIPVQAPWAVGFRPTPTSVEQLQVSGDFGDYVSATEAAGILMGRSQMGLEGFKVVETRDVEVKGATSAEVVRFTITDDKGAPVSGEWIIVAQWPKQQTAVVSILTPQYQPELERAVLDSMRFRPSS